MTNKLKVELISHTPNALELLLWTKNTRLQAKGLTMEDIKNWSDEKKQQELDYMLKTIKSSWEFVDYTFNIRGCSRAFTHQFVRTKQGSFAQQSQRTVNMGVFDFVMPERLEKKENGYEKVCVESLNSRISMIYDDLTKKGIPPQDARSILPTNVATNIIGKFDLRTLSEMAEKRLCTRAQGEYQKIFAMMKQEVLKVHPWAEKFIRVYCGRYGICQFPNYKECPLKNMCYNPETQKCWDEKKKPQHPDKINEAAERLSFEATPKWKGNS
jgi:flavin-dependent thymidylate synthase